MSHAEQVILALPVGEERSRLVRGLGEVVATLHMELRAPVAREHPDLDQGEYLPEKPDTALEPEEEAFVRNQDAAAIAELDERLLAECSVQWRKAARVVAATMSSKSMAPLGFLARRLDALSAAGRLEARGDLNYIRFSEVRLPDDSAA